MLSSNWDGLSLPPAALIIDLLSEGGEGYRSARHGQNELMHPPVEGVDLDSALQAVRKIVAAWTSSARPTRSTAFGISAESRPITLILQDHKVMLEY